MVGGSGGLTEYLVQQSQEFHRRVDDMEVRVQNIEDKLDVLEYNITNNFLLLIIRIYTTKYV